jgi:hypothetical protein
MNARMHHNPWAGHTYAPCALAPFALANVLINVDVFLWRYLNHLHCGSADALLQHNDFAFSLTCVLLMC